MTIRLGRNARLFEGATAIGYGKNISTDASAEMIKEYSMDSTTPALTGAGKQTFAWSAERLYTSGAWLTKLLAGTTFTMIFAPTGSSSTAPYETWTNCRVLKRGVSAGESGGIIEKVSGEAESVTVTDA